MENTAKTDNFLKAIKKYANAQKSEMQNEVKQLKEEKLKETEQKASRDSEKMIKDRLEQKRGEQTSILAKKTQEGQKKLFLERSAMTEKIFSKAENKLIGYTNTDEYKQKLIESAKNIAALFAGKDCVLYVREKDMTAAESIKALFDGKAEINVDRKIKIGGIRGYCKTLSIVADETLDSKLALQREWFVEKASLSVL